MIYRRNSKISRILRRSLVRLYISKPVIGSVRVNTDPMQPQDSFNATGILNGVGNITDLGSFVTTLLDKSNSTSIGKGNFTTIDGEIANYTGHDVGKTDDNGMETFKVFRFSKAIQKLASDFSIM